MRILYINTIAGRTAVGTIIDSLASAMIANGNEVYVASNREESKIKGVVNIRIGSKADKYIHAFMARLNDSQGLHSLRATQRLINNILDIKPDIIHLHNIHGYYLNYPELFSFLKKCTIPVVWTLHDCWPMTGHCVHPIMATCELYKEANCNNCPQKHSYPKSYYDGSARNIALKKRIFGNGLNNFYFVAVSDWLAEIIHSSWFATCPTYVINNGIDTDIFHPVNNNNKNYVIAVANVWTTDKGLDDIIELRTILSKKVKIKIIGLSLQQINSMPDGIVGLPHITQKELAYEYQNALALINLSKGETFGNTLIEAMASDIPVISYDNTAPHNIITPETGYLVPNGDINMVAQKILELSNSKIQFRSREIAEEFYSKEAMQQAYNKLYEYLK